MRVPVLMLLAAAATVAACGKKAPEQPAPEPTPPPAAPTPAPAPPPADDSEARRRAEAERLAAETTRRLAAELTAMINFDFDRSDIRPGDAAKLDAKAAILLANPAVRLRIAGHCDERGSDEYNLALGNRRANAARQYLINKGIAADRLETVSYGEERPLSAGSDEGSWAQNRRDEFEITAGAERLVAPR